MQRFHNNPGSIKRHTSWSPTAFVLVIPCVMALVLAGLAIENHAVSGWIAQAAEAEFAGVYQGPATAPAQLAEPAGVTQTARRD